MKYFSAALIICISFVCAQSDNDTLNATAPRIFIDYEKCDMDYVKTEVPYVNYVIDRKDADIYIMVTTQRTASGGTEYTVVFAGQNEYAGMTDTLRHCSKLSDSDDTIRKDFTQQLKIGLMRYLANTPVAQELSITLPSKPSGPVSRPVYDRWKSWVFSINLNAYLQGQQMTKYNTLYTTLSATKTTENFEMDNTVYYNYIRNYYEIDTTTIVSTSKIYGGTVYASTGINDHWSIETGIGSSSSTYSNIKWKAGGGPTLEYSFFPYSQATSRELRFDYTVSAGRYVYYDTTIYDKTRETLFRQTLSMTIDTKQKWGTISMTFSGANYLHDYHKNCFTAYGNLSLPLVKGLSFTVYINASWIHDQLSLSKKGLTAEDVLLQIRQLETQYDYYTTIGLSYTFGSIYSNVVNPRFGD